jgi:hypothetical protein
MPRYFFHLRNDIEADDDEGEEWPDAATARTRAIRYAQEMAALSVVSHGRIRMHHHVDVADESGGVLFSVTFGDAVKIEP